MLSPIYYARCRTKGTICVYLNLVDLKYSDGIGVSHMKTQIRSQHCGRTNFVHRHGIFHERKKRKPPKNNHCTCSHDNFAKATNEYQIGGKTRVTSACIDLISTRGEFVSAPGRNDNSLLHRLHVVGWKWRKAALIRPAEATLSIR